MGGGDDLVIRGRTWCHTRHGIALCAIGAAVTAVAGMARLFGLTESTGLPVKIFIPAVYLAGLGITIGADFPPRCRACSKGLKASLFTADVASRAEHDVRVALHQRDAHAIVAAIEANPRPETEKYWGRLSMSYCPNCVSVAIVYLEAFSMFTRDPPSQTVSGPGVREMLRISTVYNG